jgi:uncharacterized protein
LRCVFDTNVLISALLLPDSLPRRALHHALSNGDVLISSALLDELSEVLSRKQFRRYVDLDEIQDFSIAFTQLATWVDISSQLTVCRDPTDDKFLGLAVDGNASHIVTGDPDLLTLHPFRGIQILSPRDFLEI